jgi:uncharacterized membrane protein
MLLLVLTMIFDYVVQTVLVGIAFGVFLLSARWRFRRWPETFSLMAVFAILASYYLPAVFLMDTHVTIGNPEVARFLGGHHSFQFGDLFGIGFGDIAIWFIEAIIARAVGHWTKNRVTAYHPA